MPYSSDEEPEGSPASGERPSIPPAPPQTPLYVCVAYHLGRWSRTTIHAAIALEAFLSAPTPQAWVPILDQLEETIAPHLADDPRPFP